MIPMIVVGIFGSIVGGSIEDMVMPTLQELPNNVVDCNDTQNSNWQELCENQKKSYNKGISLMNFAGFISGFSIAGVIIGKVADAF